MVVVCGKDAADEVEQILTDEGENVFRLGEIVGRTGKAVEFTGQSDLC
jgi:uncharacterized Ntn-hydrolase superfamily protein